LTTIFDIFYHISKSKERTDKKSVQLDIVHTDINYASLS